MPPRRLKPRGADGGAPCSHAAVAGPPAPAAPEAQAGPAARRDGAPGAPDAGGLGGVARDGRAFAAMFKRDAEERKARGWEEAWHWRRSEPWVGPQTLGLMGFKTFAWGS
jgi:hypothetical protein